jgi:hypothetical protein
MFGAIFLLIGVGGLLATLVGWSTIAAAPASCVSGCTTELDPNNSVLIISGVVISMVLFALGAILLGISYIVPARASKKSG